MGQILFYDESGMRVFDCSLFDIQPPERTELDVTGLEDMEAKTIIRTGTTATASITLGETKAELDPTTMKRIAKYNLDKDFEETNRKIESAKSRLKALQDEISVRENKLETIDKVAKMIWEDECFDEDDYLFDKQVYYDKEDDDWE